LAPGRITGNCDAALWVQCFDCGIAGLGIASQGNRPGEGGYKFDVSLLDNKY